MFKKVFYVGADHSCYAANEYIPDDFFWRNDVHVVMAWSKKMAIQKYNKGEYVK